MLALFWGPSNKICTVGHLSIIFSDRVCNLKVMIYETCFSKKRRCGWNSDSCQ